MRTAYYTCVQKTIDGDEEKPQREERFMLSHKTHESHNVGTKAYRQQVYASKAASRRPSPYTSPRHSISLEGQKHATVHARHLDRDEIESIVQQSMQKLMKDKKLNIGRHVNPVQHDILDKESREEYIYSINQYSTYGIQSSIIDSELAEVSTRRLEMEYWRLKIKLKERELENNFKTMLNVGSDVLESFLGALDISGLHVKGLGKRTHEAVDEGKFHGPIKYYVQTSSPQGESFLSNPFVSFMSTFAAIAFSNHLAGKREELEKKSRKKTKQHHKQRRMYPRSNSAHIDPEHIYTSYKTAPDTTYRPRSNIVSPSYDPRPNASALRMEIPYDNLLNGERNTPADFQPQRSDPMISSSSSDDEVNGVLGNVVPVIQKVGRHANEQSKLRQETLQLNEKHNQIQEL